MKENEYSSNLSKVIEILRDVDKKTKVKMIKGVMKKSIKRGIKPN